MDKIAVLIPCYNESQTIKKVVEDWKKELPEATIYVYDNNSSDNTAAIAREAGAVVRYEYQQGKGNVIRRMFREIDAECYIMIDGDDTYPAEFGREIFSSIAGILSKSAIFSAHSTYVSTEEPLTFTIMFVSIFLISG